MKRKTILITCIMMLLLTALSILAMERTPKNKIPDEVLQMVKNRNTANSLAKGYYTINEQGFQAHYIADIEESKTYKRLKDLLYPVDHWLFVAELDGRPDSILHLGKTNEYMSKYSTLAFTGGGEMFYHTLALADPSGKNDVVLLHYAGNYYFMRDDLLYLVPKSKSDYEMNPYVADTPIKSADFLKLVLNNKN